MASSAKGVDVVELGEICIDWVLKIERFPEVDEQVFIKESSRFPGGVIANFVVGFARLGGRPGFIGGVGEDEYGRFLLEALRREGVDASYVEIRRGGSTAVNFVVVDASGVRRSCRTPS